MSKAKPRRPLLIELDATPGSSIGKFAPHEATEFLSRIRVLCGSDGRLLLGMDLVKDKAVLEAAYDDPLGVTAAFNLNILNSVNRILGSDFDVRQWRHVARYDEARVEDRDVPAGQEGHLGTTSRRPARIPRRREDSMPRTRTRPPAPTLWH